MAKNEIRQLMRVRRNELSLSDRHTLSNAVSARLFETEAYRAARSVMVYLTHGSEVNTDALLARALGEGKTVLAPVVNQEKEREMYAAQIRCRETDVSPGAFCIPEPRAAHCRRYEPGSIDLVIVPGLAFDRYGHRLGYGKGYYDLWLGNFRREQRVGIAYHFQLVSTLPREKDDVPLGCIVTDRQLLKTIETD